MNANPKMTQERIPSLDGLRALAICLVILSHSMALVWKDFHQSLGRWESISLSLLQMGHLGVLIFFSISGFLITSLLLNERRISLSRFYFRRTFRIFVPFYFYILFLLLIRWFGFVETSDRNLLVAATYTSNYLLENTPGNWYVGHSWSLAVEEQFYLLFPLILTFLGRRKTNFVLIASLVCCPLLRLSYEFSYRGVLEFNRFELVADSIAVGCLLAINRPWLHSTRFYRKLLGSRAIIPVIAAVFALSWLARIESFNNRTLYVLVGISALNLLIVFALDYVVTNHQTFIGRVLNASPVVFIGSISYSLYIWQQLILGPDFRIPILARIVLVFSVSFIMYRLVERPTSTVRGYFEQRVLGVLEKGK